MFERSFVYPPYQLVYLARNHVGLVPATDVDINIIRRVEIIDLGVTTIIPTSTLERSHSLSQKVLSHTVVVILEPVYIHITIARRVRAPALMNLPVATTTDTVAVGDEVNTARLEGQTNRAMVTHREGTLDTILLENGLEHLANESLAILVHVRHKTYSVNQL